MLSFIKKNKLNAVLVLILMSSFLLHLPALFYAFPLKNAIGDEVTTMSTIFKMLSDHTLRPAYFSFYHLPVTVFAQLPFYILFLFFLLFSGAFPSIAVLKSFTILNYGAFLPFARFITALFAVVVGYMVYRVARKLFRSEAVGVVAAFLLSFNFLFFQTTHFARAWALQIFLILLALFSYLCFFEKPEPTTKDYFFVGLTTILATGVHIPAVFVYLVFLMLYAVREWEHRDSRSSVWNRSRYFVYLQIFILAGFAFLYWLNPSGWLIYYHQSGVEKADVLRDWNLWTNLVFYAKVLFSYDTLLAVFAIPSFVFFWKKNCAMCLSFLLFIAVYIGTLSFLVHSEPRFILPVVPFLVLPVAAFLVWCFEKITSAGVQRSLAGVGIAAVLFLPILWCVKITGENTLLLARQFIFSLPEGTAIVSTNPYLDLPENKDAAAAMRARKKNYDTVERRFIVDAKPQDLPSPRYFVITNGSLLGADPVGSALREKKFQYALISFWGAAEGEKLRALLPKSASRIRTFYPTDKIFPALTDIANNIENPISTLFDVQRTGPYIEVYSL